MTRSNVAGGLVDSPDCAEVYNSLLGLHLEQEDEFADFQNNYVVYHDIGDCSTDEPTMDGTADAIYMMAISCCYILDRSEKINSIASSAN